MSAHIEWGCGEQENRTKIPLSLHDVVSMAKRSESVTALSRVLGGTRFMLQTENSDQYSAITIVATNQEHDVLGAYAVALEHMGDAS